MPWPPATQRRMVSICAMKFCALNVIAAVAARWLCGADAEDDDVFRDCDGCGGWAHKKCAMQRYYAGVLPLHR
jgi:hypothetical protein